MVELLVAVFVISVGLFGVLGALGYGVSASRSGELMSEAVNHCTHLIELIRSRNLDFQGSPPPPPSSSGINDANASDRRALDAYPFADDFPPGTPFTRNVRIERVGSSSGSYDYEVMKITCTLYWEEQGAERSVRFEALHKQQ